MYEDAAYITGNFPPIRTPDPAKKDYNYFLRNCTHVYSTFLKGGAMIPYSATRVFNELRAFANGMQPEDFYKKYLAKYEMDNSMVLNPQVGYTAGDNRKKPKGFLRPLWEVLSPAPKIVNSLVGTLTKTQTDIYADPIDAISKSASEDAKMDLWVTTQNMEVLKAAYQMAGVEMAEPEFIPESADELQLYEDMGGFRPAYARVMEKLIQHTMDASDWQYIENKLYRDYVSLNVFGLKVYYDAEIGKYLLRPVDPAMAGVQYSEFNDCRTSEWAYEFRYETISRLVQEFPEKDFEYWQKLAFKFCGHMNNPASGDWKSYSGSDANGFMKFDFFKVPVLDTYWLDNEGEQQVVQKGKRRDKVYTVDYSEKVDDKDGKTSRYTTKRYCYGATWVIGTTDIYNYGKQYDQHGNSSLPFHFYVGDGKSIVQQLIPLLHNFQVLWLKYLNALAMAVNSGYWVSADLLANIASGGDVGSTENDKEVALRRFLETGIGFYSRINATGTQNLNDMPIHEFRGGMGQIFVDIMAAFQFNMQMVESITGINPIVLGATPNPNAPVGTTQMSVAAVSSVLKPIIDAYLSVKTNVAQDICRLVHITAHTYPFCRKQYEKVIGEFDMQVLLQADKHNTEYGIRLDVRPGDMEKQAMIQMIQAASQTDRDGATGGLSGMEGIILIRRLESGIPMAQVELEFTYRQRRNIREAQKRASDNAAQQTQLTMQSAQQAAQLQDQSAQAQHQRDVELQKLKNEGVLQNTQLQEGLRYEKEANVQGIKAGTEKYTADVKSNSQQLSDYMKAETAKQVAREKTTKDKATAE